LIITAFFSKGKSFPFENHLNHWAGFPTACLSFSRVALGRRFHPLKKTYHSLSLLVAFEFSSGYLVSFFRFSNEIKNSFLTLGRHFPVAGGSWLF